MFNKNKIKADESQKFYVIESNIDNVCHIVEEKLLEVMLAGGDSLNNVINYGYVKRLGWHFGNDGKVYERHSLNDFGINYRDRLYDQGYNCANYVKALNEMTRGINEKNLVKEKEEIKQNFKVNLINKIYKYERSEMKNQTKNDDLSR